MNEISLTEVASGLFFAGLLCAPFLGIRLYRLNKNCHDALLKFDMLQNHVAAMCSAAVNIGKSIDHLDRKLDALADRQEKYELKEPQGMTRTYGQAKVLLNNGVKMDEIVENCGMSYGEVELIDLMNRLEVKQSKH